MIQSADRTTELIVRRGQSLRAIPDIVDGEPVIRIVVDDDRTEDERQESLARALNAIGSWKHLDSDEVFDELDRIRHESEPAPIGDL